MFTFELAAFILVITSNKEKCILIVHLDLVVDTSQILASFIVRICSYLFPSGWKAKLLIGPK